MAVFARAAGLASCLGAGWSRPVGAQGGIVECGALPPASGICSVVAGNGSIVLRGTVLAADQIFHGGSVAVDAQGTITCVGCACTTSGATLVTCPQGVI